MKKLLLCLLLFFFGLSGVQAKEHWKHGGWGHRHFWYGNRGWYGGGYGGGYWRGGVWIAVQPYSYPYYPGYYGYPYPYYGYGGGYYGY
jgi:hypothetical protein